MAMWNPWRGCHRYSEGCRFCYIHKGDAKRGIETNQIVKGEKYDAPIAINKKGEYTMKSGQTVYCCFSTDFLLEDADQWRLPCWQMIKQRQDLHFVFLTKRIERFLACIPDDWGDGYDNVTVGCTVENQEMADQRLGIFMDLPIKHRNIILQPLLEAVNIEKYLNQVELVMVGGEYDKNARVFDYNWVQSVREQCIKHKVNFQFHQCGSNFMVDGNVQKLNYGMLYKRAKEFNINYTVQE